MSDIAATLKERGSRYGRFDGHANVTQGLKTTITDALLLRNKTLPDDMQEALDMICHKIGRIVNGDHNYDDSWVDIAGYAKLVSDRLQRVGEHSPKQEGAVPYVKGSEINEKMRQQADAAKVSPMPDTRIPSTAWRHFPSEAAGGVGGVGGTGAFIRGGSNGSAY